jgi:hypothetical protein
MGEMRNPYSIFSENLKGSDNVGDLDIDRNSKEIVCEVADRIHVPQSTDQ